MQNRYAGDIGDYVKLALLRQLAVKKTLGVAWYLHPDEGHNDDGKHTNYLLDPARWRNLDPDLFDALQCVVRNGRSVRAIWDTAVLQGRSSDEILNSAEIPWRGRDQWRAEWFERTCSNLAEASIIFADPDNGLVDDAPSRRGKKGFGKQMPISEAKALSEGRMAIVYHHNTRRKGGHDAEVDHWISQLGKGTLAVRATAYSCRTFFILNPDDQIRDQADAFCRRWADHGVRMHPQIND